MTERKRRPMNAAPLAAVLIMSVIITGCWDYRDLERRIPILGMGIDMLDETDEADGNIFQVTVEIPQPGGGGSGGAGATDEGGGGGNGGGGSGGSSPKILVKGEGRTLGAALSSPDVRLERLPQWEHLLAIAISKDVAERGISPVIDMVIRSTFLNSRARFVVVDGRAEDLLAASPNLQPLTSRFLRGLEELFAEYPRFARPKDAYAFDHVSQEVSVGLLPRVMLKGDEIVTDGAAVLESGRLVGWLDGETMEGVNWWLGKVNSAVVDFPCPSGRGVGNVTVRARFSRSNMKTRLDEQGMPEFHGEFRAFGRLVELAGCPLDPQVPAERRRLEAGAARVIDERIGRAIDRSKALNADFLHLSLLVRRHLPDAWQRMEWEETFPHVNIRVQTEVIIDDVGEWYRAPAFR